MISPYYIFLIEVLIYKFQLEGYPTTMLISDRYLYLLSYLELQRFEFDIKL